MRLIDGDVLVQVPNVRKVTEYDETGEFITYLAVPVEAIEKSPTIEAEQVRYGKWIIKKRWSMGKWHKWLECSECKYQDHNLETYEAIPFTGPSNYCPNCGAKMALEGNDNA